MCERERERERRSETNDDLGEKNECKDERGHEVSQKVVSVREVLVSPRSHDDLLHKGITDSDAFGVLWGRDDLPERICDALLSFDLPERTEIVKK